MSRAGRLSFLIIPIWPFGQINIKRVENSLFSERNGGCPTCVIFGIRFSWRTWK